MAVNLPQSGIMAQEYDRKRADFIRLQAVFIASRVAPAYTNIAELGADRCADWALRVATKIWDDAGKGE